MGIKQTLTGISWIYKPLSAIRWHGGRLVMRLFHAIYGINRHIAVFSSFSGRGYNDNPRCVSEALHAMAPDLQIVWQFSRGAKPGDLPDYVRAIPAHSLRVLRAYATAGVFVDNMNRPHYMLKFPGQLYVQTWHGDRGFKKILLDMKTGEPYPDGQQMDLAVSGSDFGSRVFRSAFGFNGEILQSGCPRNDRLLNNSSEQDIALRRKLGIPEGTRVLLYAPTFRDRQADERQTAALSLERVRMHLEKITGESWICLTRGHDRTRGVSSDASMDVTDYPEANELLLITDLLISDYSSIAGDYLLLKRPVIYFQVDREDYLCQRELYIDPDHSPLIVAHNEEELLKILSEPIDYADNCRQVLEFFGATESGHASRDVAQWIMAHLKP